MRAVITIIYVTILFLYKVDKRIVNNRETSSSLLLDYLNLSAFVIVFLRNSIF